MKFAEAWLAHPVWPQPELDAATGDEVERFSAPFWKLR